ncbi:MAG: phosphoribosyl-ATP pyrophosphohydrolase [Candidatus Yanofskybacteria bacterium CG10_big_fil_rev_8_21_14_0_10_36_16]|uniref:Phosphoribosyl-ATP pyrophosphohydrolase n=1 Tax=Candidatus Yanofskybacteria bacterium CG10_big_fil_rev_8_21_14_0_10_36_16 TaxID=1975096 RepID=A0A2J0QBR4_9BACT|nr:MAG: phosphoribosyl-ATP pyrophosphohydrolase [Candidatus Yanofskybacteria bacterium CG10_big_fil_rev_8_21_14_0_10_36_16]
MRKLPKLVRDKIKDIAHERFSRDFKWHHATRPEEYWLLLVNKLAEEANEVKYALSKDEMQEELADLQEVIDAIIDFKKLSRRQINKIKRNKKRHKGGFKEGIVWDNPS